MSDRQFILMFPNNVFVDKRFVWNCRKQAKKCSSYILMEIKNQRSIHEWFSHYDDLWYDICE